MSTATVCTSCGETAYWHVFTGPSAKTAKAYCATVRPYYRRGVSGPEPEPHTLPAMHNLTYTESGKQTIIDRTRVSPNIGPVDIAAVRSILADIVRIA